MCLSFRQPQAGSLTTGLSCPEWDVLRGYWIPIQDKGSRLERLEGAQKQTWEKTAIMIINSFSQIRKPKLKRWHHLLTSCTTKEQGWLSHCDLFAKPELSPFSPLLSMAKPRDAQLQQQILKGLWPGAEMSQGLLQGYQLLEPQRYKDTKSELVRIAVPFPFPPQLDFPPSWLALTKGYAFENGTLNLALWEHLRGCKYKQACWGLEARIQRSFNEIITGTFIECLLPYARYIHGAI